MHGICTGTPKTAGYLYQAQMRREVTERLGLSWGEVERGTADIEGVPREVIEHFSQRRVRILEHMRAHGGRSAASAQVAALETRRAKQDVDVDRLREQWSARAAEHGLDGPALEQVTQPGTKNDRRAGILNGQGGTITATHPDAVSLDVVLDEGSRVQLEPEYLKAGHLDHGYAITAHRAQGATVDRTFVLGSQELYREWGYTAMSRHREQARFYVARTDLHDDRDLPPTADPVISGIGRLMERSHAKELALDALPQADRDALERERQHIREQLMDEPAPRRSTSADRQELEGDIRALENARHREQLLREHRAQLPWRDRRGRAATDKHLEQNLEEQAARETRLSERFAELASADTTDAQWLTSHEPQAARLVAVDHELRTRQAIDHRVDRQLNALHHNPLTPEPPTPDLDTGLDLGL